MRKPRGFSLIEIIIALAIIAVISVSLLSMFSFGYRHTVTAGQKSQADSLAQTQMEIFLSGSTTSVVPSVTDGVLTIHLTSATTSAAIEVSGSTVAITADSDGSQSTMVTFRPD